MSAMEKNKTNNGSRVCVGGLEQKVLWERVAVFRMDLREASLREWCLNKDLKEGATWVKEKSL